MRYLHLPDSLVALSFIFSELYPTVRWCFSAHLVLLKLCKPKSRSALALWLGAPHDPLCVNDLFRPRLNHQSSMGSPTTLAPVACRATSSTSCAPKTSRLSRCPASSRCPSCWSTRFMIISALGSLVVQIPSFRGSRAPQENLSPQLAAPVHPFALVGIIVTLALFAAYLAFRVLTKDDSFVIAAELTDAQRKSINDGLVTLAGLFSDEMRALAHSSGSAQEGTPLIGEVATSDRESPASAARVLSEVRRGRQSVHRGGRVQAAAERRERLPDGPGAPRHGGHHRHRRQRLPQLRPALRGGPQAPHRRAGRPVVSEAAANYAAKRTSSSATIALQQLCGAAVMNNTFCLGIFLVLIFVRGLPWVYTAETLSILTIEVVVAIFCQQRTMRPVLALFILGLGCAPQGRRPLRTRRRPSYGLSIVERLAGRTRTPRSAART